MSLVPSDFVHQDIFEAFAEFGAVKRFVRGRKNATFGCVYYAERDSADSADRAVAAAKKGEGILSTAVVQRFVPNKVSTSCYCGLELLMRFFHQERSTTVRFKGLSPKTSKKLVKAMFCDEGCEVDEKKRQIRSSLLYLSSREVKERTGLITFWNRDDACEAVEVLNGKAQKGYGKLVVRMAPPAAEREERLRKKNSTNKVYVGRFDINVDEKTLEDLFPEHKNSRKIQIIPDKTRSEAYAFITYDLPGYAKEVVDQSKAKSIGDTVLKVAFSYPRNNRKRRAMNTSNEQKVDAVALTGEQEAAIVEQEAGVEGQEPAIEESQELAEED